MHVSDLLLEGAQRMYWSTLAHSYESCNRSSQCQQAAHAQEHDRRSDISQISMSGRQKAPCDFIKQPSTTRPLHPVPFLFGVFSVYYYNADPT